jgi:hypothetical protein
VLRRDLQAVQEVLRRELARERHVPVDQVPHACSPALESEFGTPFFSDSATRITILGIRGSEVAVPWEVLACTGPGSGSRREHHC